jgi:hypothetical protein
MILGITAFCINHCRECHVIFKVMLSVIMLNFMEFENSIVVQVKKKGFYNFSIPMAEAGSAP